MAHTDSTTPSDVRPQAPVGDTPGTSDRGQTPQPAHKYRFPTLIDLLALVGIWYLLQFVGLLAARLAGFDFPDWDLLRGNVAPTPEQQDALARFTAFTYLVTMGLMILFTLFYRRLRHGTRKTLRFSARGLNPVLLLWGLVMMLAAGIVIEPVVELLPMPSSAVYGRGFWAIITLVVMAPLLEEFLCRGIILESVRAKYGVKEATKGGGQILIGIAGRGWYQEEGKNAVEILPGTIIHIPANVKHWHGAATDSWFAHLAFEVPGEKTSNEWLEAVTDEEYNKLEQDK
jgi:membrane protease YdiL (CAAX protease family)